MGIGIGFDRINGRTPATIFGSIDIYVRFERLENDETGLPEIPPDKKILMMAQFLMNPFRATALAAGR
jgi:hypothetical protein